MIRTKLTALMYAAVLVAILIVLLAIVVYIVITFPKIFIGGVAIGLLYIYYRIIYKELKSRKED